MDARSLIRASLLLCAALAALRSLPGQAQSPAAEGPEARETRDGQRDFDFEIGTWRTHLSRLREPLSGSSAWVEYEGTTIVRQVWGGDANLVELDVEGPAGQIQGLSLRLYDPRSRQWSLHFANRRDGALVEPAIGEFVDGRGEFYSQESFDGRAILVRFVITVVTPDSVRFEQSFSADGGRTWEANWIATDTRMDGEPSPDR